MTTKQDFLQCERLTRLYSGNPQMGMHTQELPAYWENKKTGSNIQLIKYQGPGWYSGQILTWHKRQDWFAGLEGARYINNEVVNKHIKIEDKNEHVVLIAAHLHQAGFATRVQGNSIMAYLSRPITKQEIEVVLDQEFDEIEFKIEMGAGNNFAMITV